MKSFTKLLFNCSIVKTLFLLIGLVVSLTQCEEATLWDLEPSMNGQLVVEAILTDESQIQQIKLSQSVDGLNLESSKVTDARVSVRVNEVVYPFSPDPNESGLYKSEFPFALLPDLDYKLDIQWAGKNYEASSRLAPVAPIQKFKFARTESNVDSLFIEAFPFVFNPNQQAMYEMHLDWSQVSSGGNLQKAKIVFYTFKQLDENGIFRPIRDTLFFPKGTQVVVKKFGLNDDFAAYLRALAFETDWNSSLFIYSGAANIPTNISNGGLGFFSTCAVLTDTLIAE